MPTAFQEVLPRASWFIILSSLEDYAVRYRSLERLALYTETRDCCFCCIQGRDSKEDERQRKLLKLELDFIASHQEMLNGAVNLRFQEWQPDREMHLPTYGGPFGCCLGCCGGWFCEGPQVKWLEVSLPVPHPSTTSPLKGTRSPRRH